jgi:hypothetical protein
MCANGLAEIGQQNAVPSETPGTKARNQSFFPEVKSSGESRKSWGMPTRPHENGKAAEERVPFRERLTCSVADAQAASGISRSALYQEMRAGNLKFVKRGTRRLVRVQSLLKLLGA